MRKTLFTLAISLLTIAASYAQENNTRARKPFSPEEFQAKQRTFIAEKAELTAEEAEAFFPIFFELQKKKFEIEHNARKETRKPRGEKMSEEECREHVYKMADTKIEIAKLEREYTDKYLQVLSPCKVRRVQFAEGSFQRDLMKKMTDRRHNASQAK